MDINTLRKTRPDFAELSDDQVVDVIHQAYYPDLERDQVAKALGLKAPTLSELVAWFKGLMAEAQAGSVADAPDENSARLDSNQRPATDALHHEIKRRAFCRSATRSARARRTIH
jgi:hypothetical protein